MKQVKHRHLWDPLPIEVLRTNSILLIAVFMVKGCINIYGLQWKILVALKSHFFHYLKNIFFCPVKIDIGLSKERVMRYVCIGNTLVLAILD